MLPFDSRDQLEAQGLVEYALVLMMVAMAAIVGLALLGTTVFDFFQEFTDRLIEIAGG